MTCQYCKGENITKGKPWNGNGKIMFLPEQKNLILKEIYPIEIMVCRDCGMVVGLGVDFSTN